MSVFYVKAGGSVAGVGHGAQGYIYRPPAKAPAKQAPAKVVRVGNSMYVEAKGDIVGVGHDAVGTINGQTKRDTTTAAPAPPSSPDVFIVEAEGDVAGVGNGARGVIA